MWWWSHDLFNSGGNQGGNNLKWWSLSFFFSYLFVFFPEKTTRDEGLGRNRHPRTEGTDPGSTLTRVVDVREETKKTRCFFNDLW